MSIERRLSSPWPLHPSAGRPAFPFLFPLAAAVRGEYISTHSTPGATMAGESDDVRPGYLHACHNPGAGSRNFDGVDGSRNIYLSMIARQRHNHRCHRCRRGLHFAHGTWARRSRRGLAAAAHTATHYCTGLSLLVGPAAAAAAGNRRHACPGRGQVFGRRTYLHACLRCAGRSGARSNGALAGGGGGARTPIQGGAARPAGRGGLTSSRANSISTPLPVRKRTGQQSPRARALRGQKGSTPPSRDAQSAVQLLCRPGSLGGGPGSHIHT